MEVLQLKNKYLDIKKLTKSEFLLPVKALIEALNIVGRIQQGNNSDGRKGKDPWSEAWLVK